MRARVGRGGARGRVGLKLESGSVGEEDAPDRRGPPGGESGRGRGRWARLGQEAKNGPRETLGRKKGKGRERACWAERVRGKRKNLLQIF